MQQTHIAVPQSSNLPLHFNNLHPAFAHYVVQYFRIFSNIIVYNRAASSLIWAINSSRAMTPVADVRISSNIVARNSMTLPLPMKALQRMVSVEAPEARKRPYGTGSGFSRKSLEVLARGSTAVAVEGQSVGSRWGLAAPRLICARLRALAGGRPLPAGSGPGSRSPLTVGSGPLPSSSR